jgi:hypothetical protein
VGSRGEERRDGWGLRGGIKRGGGRSDEVGDAPRLPTACNCLGGRLPNVGAPTDTWGRPNRIHGSERADPF